MNMHNRLSIRSIIFEYSTPMSTICQHFKTIDVQVCFTSMWDFTWRVVSLDWIIGGLKIMTNICSLFSFFFVDSFQISLGVQFHQ